jgi:hypothetical protein
VPLWQTGAAATIVLLENAATKSLAVLVGLFGIIACDVVQAIDNLLLEIRFLLCPGPERGRTPCTVRVSSPVICFKCLSIVLLEIGLTRLRPGNTNSSFTRLS